VTSKVDRAKTEALAKKYLKKEKFKNAISEYTKLLTGDQQDIPIRNTISDLYIRMNENDKAAEELKKVAELYEKRGVYSKSIATYKRIKRLIPDDILSINRLADLYQVQGFLSEAKKEYKDLTEKIVNKGQPKDVIPVFEELLKLDRDDIQSRMTLAELYEKAGNVDRAVDELNIVAQFKLKSESLSEAEKILNKALALKKDHTLTLENLVGVLIKSNKKKEALALVNEILQKDKENLRLLRLLGDLYFEEGDYEKAEEIFSEIKSKSPKDLETAIKMGKIHIRNKQYDEAFNQYEPLVDMLIKKHKEEKAIGLLGLVLEGNPRYVPALEKLGSVYEIKKQKENLEIVYKLLFEEYQRKGLKEKAFSVLGELRYLSPKDMEYHLQYRYLKDELGITEETTELGQRHVVVDEAEEIIETDLAKADLYIQQGLIKNAKRILDQLKLRFPDQPRIQEKLDALKVVPSGVRDEEIVDRLKKADEKLGTMFGKEEDKDIEKEKKTPEQKEEPAGERVTAAEIFAETDIIPVAFPKEIKKEFYDLSEKIDEELEAIKEACLQQTRGPSRLGEKELSDIVSIFTKSVEERIDMKDSETRYNLGVAFLEQGLVDEAIQEFKRAQEDKNLRLECSSLLSLCYKKKGEFQEALKWIESALKLAVEDSNQFYALQYEAASLYEEMNQTKKAMKIYKKIKKWNPEFRDVASKIKNAGK
jgi:tetratricopeptide (TPR) repeat protein